MRISYRMRREDDNGAEAGFFHMFRSANLRFFNNVAVAAKSEEEKVESLKAIADTTAVAMEMAGLDPELWMGKLEKRRSKVIVNEEEEAASATSTTSFKDAMSSMTSQISRLNPLAKLKRSPRKSDGDEDQEAPVEAQEASLSAKESVLAPFAKITKGIRDIGAPLTSSETQPEENFMSRRLREVDTKTVVTLF